MHISEILQNPDLSLLLQWLAGVSLFTFLLSLILIPWIVGRLRVNYFLVLDRKISYKGRRKLEWYFQLLARNIIGWILIVAGVIMLFLPGQGLITIVLGFLFISFPGKHKLTKKFIRNIKLQHTLDWLRDKRKKVPFLWPKK